MSFRQRVKYALVKQLGISNKTAQLHINNGNVKVNNHTILKNCLVTPYDTIVFNNKVVVEPNFEYYAFYKPVGIESTFAKTVKENLLTVLPEQYSNLFVVGRLDKASEGLLLLTNNGHIFDTILRPENHMEKKYQVKVNLPLTDFFIATMQDGVPILGKTTLPCLLEPINDFEFCITLKQGLNRQIRRMCHKLGYSVLQLKRITIGKILLNQMQPNDIKTLTTIEVSYLVNI